MNVRKSYQLFLFCIPILVVIASVCALTGMKTHFFLWELLVDGKTIVLAALFFFIVKPGGRQLQKIRKEAQELGVFTWGVLPLLGAFTIPVFVACVPLGAGLLLKKVSFANPDNAVTLLLTMAFDIPAVFIFTVTTVFVEEYIFRGYVLTEFLKNGASTLGLIVSSLLWALYAGVEVLPLDEYSLRSVGLLIYCYIAVGIAASVLYRVTGSLWTSYAFRIGIITYTPIVLSGVTGATDAFFMTENIFFYGDGIISSTVLLLSFIGVWFATQRKYS